MSKIKGAIVLLVGLSFTARAADKLISPASDALGKAISTARPGDIIFLKNGIYKRGIQNVDVAVSRSGITIIGESKDGVVITGAKVSAADPNSTNTLLIEGDGFYAENITIENTGTGGQAQALRVEGDSVVFNNCRIRGYQDAHRANQKRSYYVDCEAMGTVDFIYGSGKVMYDNSSIVARGGGYVTAPENEGTFIFRSCTLTPASGVADGSCYLGRPWGNINVRAVYFNCKMGAHINAKGWNTMGDGVPTLFGEYNSMNLDNSPADVSGRTNGGVQLTAEQAEPYDLSTFFGSWNPRVKVESQLLPTPTAITLDGATLSWNAVAGARGYLIYRNDSMMYYTANTSYSVGTQSGAMYTIKTVNQYGRPGSDIPTGIWSGKAKSGYKIYAFDNVLYAPENEGVEVYSLMGKRVLSSASARQVSLSVLPRGLYVARVLLDKKGSFASQKIVVQ